MVLMVLLSLPMELKQFPLVTITQSKYGDYVILAFFMILLRNHAKYVELVAIVMAEPLLALYAQLEHTIHLLALQAQVLVFYVHLELTIN